MTDGADTGTTVSSRLTGAVMQKGEPMDDLISRAAALEAVNSLIDRFERILSDIRESTVDDSVCGMCEYDGAFVGQSGDWCNECPGFEKDNCFKLSDECRKRWFDSVALPSAQQWIPCSERLPKVRDWVLCQCRAGIMDVFRLTEDGSWNKNYPHAEYMGGFVIAWMPLPAPYRPEGDEKHGTPRSV